MTLSVLTRVPTDMQMRKMMKRNKAKEDETDDYRNMPHKNINFEPNVSWRCVLERCLAYLQELKRQQEQEQAKRTLPTELIAGSPVCKTILCTEPVSDCTYELTC